MPARRWVSVPGSIYSVMRTSFRFYFPRIFCAVNFTVLHLAGVTSSSGRPYVCEVAVNLCLISLLSCVPADLIHVLLLYLLSFSLCLQLASRAGSRPHTAVSGVLAR